MADTYGKALIDYANGKKDGQLKVHCSISETEILDVAVFNRSPDDMPQIEKHALRLCEGKVLDIGAGAGIHSLYLQEKGLDVTALDISAGAVEAMKINGIKNAVHSDFFDFKGQKFDTLLFLMNGIGVPGRLERFPEFFEKIRELLTDGGQVIFDSSDLVYMYEEEDGSYLFDLNAGYYGELEYRMDYEGEEGEPFRWIFVDYQTMAGLADMNGFNCECLEEDDHYHYLARITKK